MQTHILLWVWFVSSVLIYELNGGTGGSTNASQQEGHWFKSQFKKKKIKKNTANAKVLLRQRAANDWI